MRAQADVWLFKYFNFEGRSRTYIGELICKLLTLVSLIMSLQGVDQIIS